jgi:hypothetical protein
MLQIGGDGAGSYIQAVTDNLRISDRVRTAQEISDHLLEGLTVSGWSLNPATTSIELWPTWYWWITPTITATTNVGALSMPVAAASWASSNPGVAILETSSGRFKLPTLDGVNIDTAAAGLTDTVANLKHNLKRYLTQLKFQNEERSRFRGYKTSDALPALGYQVVKVINVYEDIPPGFPELGNPGQYFPDYHQILTRFNAQQLVNELGVKEFWIWGYHFGRIAPVEVVAHCLRASFFRPLVCFPALLLHRARSASP